MSAEDDCTYLESSNSVPGISFGSRRSREDMGDEDEWQKMKRRCPEWGRLDFKWDVHVEGRIHDPKLDVHGLHQESMQPSDVSSRERALPTDRHPKQNNEPGSSDGVLETRTREELRNGRSEQQDNIEDSCKESPTEAIDPENDGDSLDVEPDPMGRCDQLPLKVDTLEGFTIENKCTHHNTTAQPRAMCYPAKAVTMSELRTTKECGEEETNDHSESSFSPSSSLPAFNGMGTSTSTSTSTSSSSTYIQGDESINPKIIMISKVPVASCLRRQKTGTKEYRYRTIFAVDGVPPDTKVVQFLFKLRTLYEDENCIKMTAKKKNERTCTKDFNQIVEVRILEGSTWESKIDPSRSFEKHIVLTRIPRKNEAKVHSEVKDMEFQIIGNKMFALIPLNNRTNTPKGAQGNTMCLLDQGEKDHFLRQSIKFMNADKHVLKEIELEPLRIFAQASNHASRKTGSRKSGTKLTEEKLSLEIEKENKKYREALDNASKTSP